MTRGLFGTITAAIATKASTWTLDTVNMKLARGLHEQEVHPKVVQKFCKEIRDLLHDLETGNLQ
jgi:hypothetical protein